jgi:hypothetical protein
MCVICYSFQPNLTALNTRAITAGFDRTTGYDDRGFPDASSTLLESHSLNPSSLK